MIILGLVGIVLGWIFGSSILVNIGILLLVVGLILNLVPIRGNRRRYY